MLLLLHAIIPCLHTCMKIHLCGSVNSELQTLCYVVSLSLLSMHNFHVVFNHFQTYISCVWSHHISCSLCTTQVIRLLMEHVLLLLPISVA